ncbi:MAG: hypothetical protein P1U68_12930 [Verrucomicrobiales bacterium]|nr:hypothetical protein [Verrucomicrobiales bacterium]
MSESSDWQTWAALSLVAITLLTFVIRGHRKKNSGCNHCGPENDC